MTPPFAAARGVGPSRLRLVMPDRLVLIVAYTLAWGALLVNRGLYWDDWTLLGVGTDAVLGQYAELGLPWVGYLFAWLFATPAPALLGHALVFGGYLLSTLILHAILRRLPGLTRTDALVAALAFALLPVNYARIALIDLTYCLSLLAFLAATWLVLAYAAEGGLARRLGALALYLVSFSTASLLVLYAVPLVLVVVVARSARGVPAAGFLLRHPDLVVLPIAYWVAKALLFAPSGAYEDYNAITGSGLLGAFGSLPAIPYQVLGEPLARAVAVAGVPGLAVGAITAAWLWRRARADEDGSALPVAGLLLSGAVLLALGVFPYLVVDLTPVIWDWSSRHQLLVPLGAGLLAAALARGVRAARWPGRAIGVVLAGALLGISGVANARTLIAYQVDWFKQQAIVQAARTLPDVRAARHIRVIDSATGFDALRRRYRFYEYNALLRLALGDTRRLVAGPASEPAPGRLQEFIARPAYQMGDYVPGPVDLELHVSAPVGVPRSADVLRLLMLEATNWPAFEGEVARLIEVRAERVAGR